jgi:hypothetical protein
MDHKGMEDNVDMNLKGMENNIKMDPKEMENIKINLKEMWVTSR